MKTTKNNKEKVICQKCGAEITTLKNTPASIMKGKDGALGSTACLTKVRTSPSGKESPVGLLCNLYDGDMEAISHIAGLISKIEEGGYLDVNGIVRRWIPSQCLSMVFSDGGFQDNLKSRGYNYTWKVLVDDLKKQEELYLKKDTDGYMDRNRWYNKKIAYDMAEDYLVLLGKHIAKCTRHSHKGRQYIKLKCWMNKGKGVYVDETLSLLVRVENELLKIKTAKSPKTLLKAVMNFDQEVRKKIKFTPHRICTEFANAYKAAGAYYTIKDLIMFEGCRLKVDKNGSLDNDSCFNTCHAGRRKFLKTEESLCALDQKAADIVFDGVGEHGYLMLGLLKDFLKYNHFDFETTKEKWSQQSQIRKALRLSNRFSRRSRK